MAYAPDSYTANPAQTDFPITFPYLRGPHIGLLIDTVPSSAFTLVSGGTILRLDTPAAGGEDIVITRTTPIDARLVDFVAGAGLSESDLDDSFDQLLYAFEETVYNAVTGMGKTGLNWDAANLQIKNVADATLDTDVPSFGQINTSVTAAQAAQTAAETAQGLAETAQGLAETAQTAAETAQGLAETAQLAAEAAAADAANYPVNYIGRNHIRINSSDVDHDFDFLPLDVKSSDNTVDIATAATIVKQIDAPWAAGTNQGGWPSTGVTLSVSSRYYIFAVCAPDGTLVDFGFDDSATAVNLLADTGARTEYALIGKFATDASANIASVAWRKPDWSYEFKTNEFARPAATADTRVLMPFASTPPDRAEVILDAVGSANGWSSGDRYYFSSSDIQRADNRSNATVSWLSSTGSLMFETGDESTAKTSPFGGGSIPADLDATNWNFYFQGFYPQDAS